MLNHILKTLTFGLLIGATLLISSCSKDDDNNTDPVAAEAIITITAPTEGAAFEQNATIHITGNIEFADGLHGYQIFIRKKADNTVLFQKDEHVHGKTVDFSEQWVNNLDNHYDLELEVIAILDHDGKTASKKVNFHAHP
ncbi:MAG: hypothetical protein LC107_11475 [Chitinophagales bacterium]|nr:hypothetical protein [Chitinophagales bacterium]